MGVCTRESGAICPDIDVKKTQGHVPKQLVAKYLMAGQAWDSTGIGALFRREGGLKGAGPYRFLGTVFFGEGWAAGAGLAPHSQ